MDSMIDDIVREIEESAAAEKLPQEEPEKKPEKKKKKRTRRERRRLRIILAVIFALTGVLIIGGFSIYALNFVSDIPLIRPYETTYDLEENITGASLYSAEGFSADLCVGSDNTGRGEISLSGNESGALFDLGEKEILYSKNMYDKLYPASITKIMTAILVFEKGNMDDTVTIEKEDLDLEEGSQMIGLEVGDQVNLGELVSAMLVYSGNDAAMALARHISGSAEAFVTEMNAYARSLGATSTHFVNPTGLHDESHYTTVYDVYLMLNKAVRFDNFVNIMQMPTYTLTYQNAEGEEKTKVLSATDHYLTGEATPPQGVTVLGGKTGTTSMAGSCLAIVSQNAYGELFVSIILHAADKTALYTDMNTLLGEIN